MTTNPRPRPALKKAPAQGHPADIDETPAPKKKPGTAHHLGEGSTSDTLRGKGKKNKKSTLRDNEIVDITVELPRSLRRRLRQAAKTADVSVDLYVQTLLDTTLPE